MAKSKDPKEAAPEGKPAEPKKKSESGNKSFVTMFSVVIAIQFVMIGILVYYIISRPPTYSVIPQQAVAEYTEDENSEKPVKKAPKKKVEVEEEDDDEEETSSKGPLITFQTDDLIINPKGARAGKYLMTSIALEVSGEEVKKEFEETRKAQVYDVLNGYLSSQSFEYLSDITKRDSLKIQLKLLLNKSIKGK
jgi:flagellar basal body-associated protein FliL